ncbi:MAG: hypothetical protein Q8L39_04675 [Burkholderiales bacterium]|nr:hypothetical protein [Burkholderiales bacterium]
MAVSVGTMIEQLDGLRDTEDLTEWEQGFVTNVLGQYIKAKKNTQQFTEKQVERVEQIWAKHFAG